MCPVLGWGYCGQKREFLEEVASELSWAGVTWVEECRRPHVPRREQREQRGAWVRKLGEVGTGLAGAQPAEHVSVFQLRS